MFKSDEQVCKSAAQELVQSFKGEDISLFELREDLKPFLKVARASAAGSSEWPFAETLIFGTTTNQSPSDNLLSNILEEHGIGNFLTQTHDRSSPFYLDAIVPVPDKKGQVNMFTNIRESLQELRADHQEFHHLYVAAGPHFNDGVLAAKAADFPSVLKQRPGQFLHRQLLNEDPEKIHMTRFRLGENRTATGRFSRYFGCVNGFKQLPTIVDLRAIKSWRPGEFEPIVDNDNSPEGRRRDIQRLHHSQPTRGWDFNTGKKNKSVKKERLMENEKGVEKR